MSTCAKERLSLGLSFGKRPRSQASGLNAWMFDRRVSAEGMKFLSDISVMIVTVVVLANGSCFLLLFWSLMRVMQRMILRSSAGQPRIE